MNSPRLSLLSRPPAPGPRGHSALVLAGLLGLAPACEKPHPSCDACDDGGVADLSDPGGPAADLAAPPGADLSGAPADLSPSGADPSKPGPRRTTSFALRVPVTANATLNITVIGPSEDAQNLSMTGAPFPLVVVSPGFSLPTSQFLVYGERLASHGFVAVHQEYRAAGDHAQSQRDTAALLDWLITPTGASAPRVQGRVDGKRVGLTGHSLGGKISLLTAQRDARVKALITIDPVDGQPPLGGMQPAALPGMGNILLPAGVPLGFLGETASKAGIMPCTPANQNYEVLYQAARAPAFAVTFARAGHMDFVNDYQSCGIVCTVCSAGDAPKTRTRDLAVKYVAAYFLWTLAGDSAARAHLYGAAFDRDQATGAVSRVDK